MIALSPSSRKESHWPLQQEHPLYRAQEAATAVFETQWFPCYSSAYIDNQKGFCWMVIGVYSRVYDGVDTCVTAASITALGVYKYTLHVFQCVVTPLGNTAKKIMTPIRDRIYPLNPVNGKRRFLLVPKSVEKWLGDRLFYPLNTRGLTATSATIHGTDERITVRVENIVKLLLEHNRQLLNPEGEVAFHYRAQTTTSSQMNAFAVPGGGMVVFRGIVDEMEAALRSAKIEVTKVTLADGSVATVDLKGVTLNDGLAALLGHEMTHVASRHSIMGLCSKLATYMALSLLRVIVIVQLRKQKKEEAQSEEERQKALDRLDQILQWAQERIESLLDLLRSKTCEYEADTTGAYFAGQAGFNPLGALWLQAFLAEKSSNEGTDFFHKYFEFLYTHPYGENRKRALLGALAEFDPKALKNRVQIDSSQAVICYDVARSSPAIKATTYLRNRLVG